MGTTKIENNGYEWIDLLNPTKEEMQNISQKYSLNYYNMVDSLDPYHLPKFEKENKINFLIVRLINKTRGKDNEPKNISSNVSIFYKDSFIITVHNKEIPFLENLKTKGIHSEIGISTISLAINIVFNVLSSYNSFIVDKMDKVDHFESSIFLRNPASSILKNIYLLKREINTFLKMLLLTDDVIKDIKPDSEEKASWQDAKDLHVKLVTLYEQVIEDLNNLLNIYISLSSQKANDIMKTLTIFSIFFMPVTFIAGIYGMNFKYMPELNYKLGYPLSLLAMLVIVIWIYLWLKKRKWM